MRHLDDATHTQVLNALKRAVNAREGWDLEPELGHLYLDEGGRVRCRNLKVPSGMWQQYGHPAHLLNAYRRLLSNPATPQERAAVDRLRAAIYPALLGMYLITEAWQPPAHLVRAMQARQERGEKMPAYKDMAGRVEVRSSVAIDWDSTLYTVSQPRPTMVLEGGVDTLSGDGIEITGRIPSLLLAVMHALQPAQHR